MIKRIAYLPLNTYPEADPDAAILATAGFAAALGCGLHVSLFAVDIPPVVSPIGGHLMDLAGMARATEERSQDETRRLQALLAGLSDAVPGMTVTVHKAILGAVTGHAAAEARYFDLALVPWSADARPSQDLAQSLIFDTGVPVVLVPAATAPGTPAHIAVAWDESRVAARALGDALRLLPPGGRLTVLTVQDEKALDRAGLPDLLAGALRLRGYEAEAVELTLDGRTIAAALQDAAVAAGAGMLAMGGFGHSRLRDFVLGGATKGILGDLRLPVLLSH